MLMGKIRTRHKTRHEKTLRFSKKDFVSVFSTQQSISSVKATPSPAIDCERNRSLKRLSAIVSNRSVGLAALDAKTIPTEHSLKGAGKTKRRNQATLEFDANALSDEAIQGLVDDWIVPMIVEELVRRLSIDEPRQKN